MPYNRGRAKRQPEPHERPWVFAGATSLAALAGFVNVVVLGFFHLPVSHMTGAVSRLSVDIAARDLASLRIVFSMVACFLLGAAISGTIIGGRKLMPGRRYGVAMMVEGGLLGASTVLLRGNLTVGLSLAAMACGVQNAMASSYYGLVIRTTHLTGIITDIGVMMGHWLRHRRIRLWQLMLLTSILTGFFIGGIAGAVAFSTIGATALAAASVVCFTAGSVYYVWRTVLAKRT
ncbi:MAG TPA: YoaK family protein [Longimicrobiaceae bacterium]|nr:YoaK family protein [Longimicrobiaceae bacterium]